MKRTTVWLLKRGSPGVPRPLAKLFDQYRSALVQCLSRNEVDVASSPDEATQSPSDAGCQRIRKLRTLGNFNHNC